MIYFSGELQTTKVSEGGSTGNEFPSGVFITILITGGKCPTVVAVLSSDVTRRPGPLCENSTAV